MKKILIIFVFTCLFVIIIVGNLFSQTDAHNTGVLYIGNGIDTVYAGGSFTNTGTATLTNNTVFNIKQHVSNSQAGMATGTGTLYLNGNAMQNINGSQVLKTYNFVSDNAAGFTLNNDLSVSNSHTYVNGLINTSATPNYMVYEAGASYTGSSDNNHVNGWVKKIGSTNFTFPVGNNTYERPIILTSLGSASEFAVKHNPPATPNHTSLYGALVLIDTNEYWTINRISGSSAVVTLTWDNAKIPVPQVLLSNVRATYYDGTFWRSIGGTGSGSVTTTGSVTSNSTSAFNTDFTIGSESFVLPLRLISFTGQRNNMVNEIKWAVANESNIKNYTLQRSDDGINFYSISAQNAANTGLDANYSYNDAAFMAGKVYYRLKYADFNGLTKYSATISISQLQDADNNFYVIKNPVTDKIDFYAGGSYKGKYIYTIAASAGQVVQTGTVDIKAGGLYSLPIRSMLATGMYILSLQNAEHSLQKTILKQ